MIKIGEKRELGNTGRFRFSVLKRTRETKNIDNECPVC